MRLQKTGLKPMNKSIILSLDIYPIEAITQAAQAFSHLSKVDIGPIDAERTKVSFSYKSESLSCIGSEFCNYLIGIIASGRINKNE